MAPALPAQQLVLAVGQMAPASGALLVLALGLWGQVVLELVRELELELELVLELVRELELELVLELVRELELELELGHWCPVASPCAKRLRLSSACHFPH